MADEFDIEDDEFSGKEFGDDFNFYSLDQPDDRKPTTRVVDSALAQLRSKENALNAARIASYTTLPGGFKSAFDAIADGKDLAESIYDKAAKDLKPSISAAKQIGRRAMPLAEKVLPPHMVDRLKELTKEQKARTRVDAEELSIAATLKDIFDVEFTLSEMDKRKADKQRQSDTEVSQKQFTTSTNIQAQTAAGIGRLVGYQDSVLMRYHRKSLELQHRHYFASRDLLIYTKAGTADIMTALKAIAKNSALPDYRKTFTSEAVKASTRARLVTAGQDRISDRIRGIPTRLIGKVKSNISQFIGGVNNASSMVGMVTDSTSGMDVGTGADIVGQQGAEAATEWAATNIGGRIGKKLGSIPQVSEINDRLQHQMENKSRMLSNKMQDAAPGSFWGMIKGMVGSVSGETETMTNDLLKRAEEAVPWDVLSRRSIIDIIPGYLSRILQQVTQANTGSPVERISYDIKREAFLSESQLTKTAATRLKSEVGSRLADSGERLIRIIDPDEALPTEARMDLLLQFTKDSNDTRAFDPIYYSKPENINSKHAELLAAHIRKAFSVTEDANGNLKADTTLSRMGSALGDLGSRVKNLGKRDDLRAATSKAKAAASERLVKASEGFNRMSRGVGSMSSLLADFDMSANRDILRKLGLITQTEAEGDRVNFDMKDLILRAQLEGKDLYEMLSPYLDEAVTTGSAAINNVKSKVRSGISRPSGSTETPSGRDRVKVSPGSVSTEDSGLFNNESSMLDLVKEHRDLMVEHLTRIGNRLDEGILTFGGGEGEAKETFLKRMVGKGIGGLKKFGKFTKASAKWGAIGSAVGIGGAGFLGYKAIGSALGLAGKLTNHVGDVYVNGEPEVPRLYAVGMKKGDKYFDKATNNPITNIKDIKGPVVDDTGNIVLSQEDFNKGLYSSNRASTALLKSIGGGLVGLYKKQFSVMGQLAQMPFQAFSKVKSYIERPVDVYVIGERWPRLRAEIFKGEGYFSHGTGRRLRTHDDIDGPVVDAKGNVVINEEELRQGLYDSQGRPLKSTKLLSKVGNLFGMGVGLAKGAVKLGIKGAKFSTNMAKGVLGIAAGRLGFGNKGSVADDRTVALLARIYTHMQTAFPIDEEGLGDKLDGLMDALNPKKKSGDVDGDGVRDGSWRDQAKNKAQAAKDAATEAMTGRGGKAAGTGAGLLGLLGLGKTRKNSYDEGEEESEGGIMQDILAYAAGDRISRFAGKVLGGGKNLVTKAGKKVLSKVAPKTAAKMAAKQAAKVAAGQVARTAAVSGATALAGTATGAGLLTAAGTGLAAVGGTLLSILTSPAVLIGAAVAVTAFAGYKAFKYFQRRADLEPIEKLRYLQYGIPIGNKDAIVAIRYLEDNLSGKIKVADNGSVTLKPSFKDIWDTFAKDFGNDPENESRAAKFKMWLYRRFIPVYVSYALACKEHDDVDPLDVDDELDSKDKALFVTKVQFGEKEAKLGARPYSIMESPWPDIELVDNRDAIKELTQLITMASERGKDIDLDTGEVQKSLWDRTKDIAKNTVPGKVFGFLKDKMKDKYVAPNMPKTDNATRYDRLANLSMVRNAKRKEGDDQLLVVPTTGAIALSKGPKGISKLSFLAKEGTPVYAAASGLVTRSDESPSERLGILIYIKHDGSGRSTRYGHLAGVTVKKGDRVKAGQLIGYIGSTGTVDEPQLHFEYRDNDKDDWEYSNKNSTINPLGYFVGPDGKPFNDKPAVETDADGKEIRPIPKETDKQPVNHLRGRKTAPVTDSKTEREKREVFAKMEKAISLDQIKASKQQALEGAGTIIPAPEVNVEAPDFDGVNGTNVAIAQNAQLQRQMQIDSTEKLAMSLETLIMLQEGTITKQELEERRRKYEQLQRQREQKRHNLPMDLTK